MRLSVISICCALAPAAALADETKELDLAERLTAAIYQNRAAFQLPGTPTSCRKTGVYHDPRIRWKQGYTEESHGARCVFFFQNVRATGTDVSYSDVKRNALPERLESRSFTYSNCNSSASLPIEDTVQVTTREGVSVSKMTRLNISRNVQWNNSINFTIGIFSIGHGNQKSVTFSGEQQEQTQLDYSIDTTVTQQIRGVSVEPGTRREVRYTKALSTDYVDFTGVATIDAEVYLSLVPVNAPAPSQPNPNWRMGWLRELTDSKAAPTIDLRGRVWNVKGEQIRREDFVTACER